MSLDTFGGYVEARLDAWGREFALARDCEYLGHVSRNMLQVLIDHKGEMPGRAQGYKPLEVDAEAQQVEDIVADIARDQRPIAIVLRAWYCGSGRKRYERHETANLLLATADERPVRLRQYEALQRLGVQTVRGALIGIARAA